MVISTGRKRASQSVKPSTTANHRAIKTAVREPRQIARKTPRKLKTKSDDRVWDVEKILQRSDDGERLLVKWKGLNPKTKRPWKKEWIDKEQLAIEREWPIEQILEEREGGTKFLVRWEGINPETKRPWPDSEIEVEWLQPATLEAWNHRKVHEHARSHAKVVPPVCQKKDFYDPEDVNMEESISQVACKASSPFSKPPGPSSILRQPGSLRKRQRVRFRSVSRA